MKWFSLPVAALIVALGLTAHADPHTPAAGAQDGASSPPRFAVPAGPGVDTDFPCYPPGFSSYRGLGFMGSCYQPCSPCAQHAWDGYCEGCYDLPPWHAFFDKLHGWIHPPAWSCSLKACEPCGTPNINWWPKTTPSHEPLSLKLQRWRAQWASKFGGSYAGFCCESCDEQGTVSAPDADEILPPAEPAPAPAVPATPAPQASDDPLPELPPSRPASDRSAWRWFPLPLTGRQDGF